MTIIRVHPCAVCGRRTYSRRDRCPECVRFDRQAPHLFCTCDDPDPRPVVLFGSQLSGSECGRCSRPIL